MSEEVEQNDPRPTWWQTLTRPGVQLVSTICLVIWVVGMTAWSVSQPTWSGAITAVALLGAISWGAWMRREHRRT